MKSCTLLCGCDKSNSWNVCCAVFNFEISLFQAIFDTFFKEWNLNEVSNLTASASTSKWVDEAKIPRFEFLTNMRRYFAVYNSGGIVTTLVFIKQVSSFHRHISLVSWSNGDIIFSLKAIHWTSWHPKKWTELSLCGPRFFTLWEQSTWTFLRYY